MSRKTGLPQDTLRDRTAHRSIPAAKFRHSAELNGATKATFNSPLNDAVRTQRALLKQKELPDIKRSGFKAVVVPLVREQFNVA